MILLQDVTFLLDVDVLIALIDPKHAAHDDTHAWFERHGSRNWATCPITENGVIRICGHPNYPNAAGTPAVIADVVDRLRHLPGHCFWPDDLSVFDEEAIDRSKLFTSRQVTDTYLLALARRHGGQLATFDRRLSTAAVKNGRHALLQIGAESG